jgi:hypothetical protein
VLHDGFLHAIWRTDANGVLVRHTPLSRRALGSIAAEGRRLARFLELGVTEARLEPVSPRDPRRGG